MADTGGTAAAAHASRSKWVGTLTGRFTCSCLRVRHCASWPSHPILCGSSTASLPLTDTAKAFPKITTLSSTATAWRLRTVSQPCCAVPKLHRSLRVEYDRGFTTPQDAGTECSTDDQ